MQAISVKELRQKFPFVKSELQKGTSFLIIYNSRPIAKLLPFEGEKIGEKIYEEATDEQWNKAALEDINKSIGDDFLTEEEVKYYLSLKPPHGTDIR